MKRLRLAFSSRGRQAATRRCSHPERGMTIPIVAGAMIALLAMVALAVDIGILVTARTSAQHAADAAALAGAKTLMNPTAPQPETARDAARTVAAQNTVMGQQVQITDDNIAVDLENRLVTVTVPLTGDNGIQLFFASVFMPGGRADISTRASAEASPNATASRCVKPIYVPNTILSQLPVAEACAAGEVIFGSSGDITAWASAQLGGCRIIRPTSPSQAQNAEEMSAGQFLSLDFGSGGSTYRCSWSSCLNNCQTVPDLIQCGQRYPVATGAMVGPTTQGVRDLIGDPADLWISRGLYQDGDTGHPLLSSPSLVIAPVWDNCTNPIRSGTAGQTAEVIGFAEFFVEGVGAAMTCPTGGGTGGGGGGGGSGGAPASNVKSRVENMTRCTEAANNGNGDVTGPLARPLRLVRTPDGQ